MRENIINFILGFILFIIIVAAAVIIFTRNSSANGRECENGRHRYNPHCITPTVTPSVTPTEGIGEITATPEPAITEEVTATPTAVPVISTAVTDIPNPGGPGDGRSDGLSSCPDCTKAHNYINQSGSPVPTAPPGK